MYNYKSRYGCKQHKASVMHMSKRLKVSIYLTLGVIFAFSFMDIMLHRMFPLLLSVIICGISLILIIAFIYDFKKSDKDKTNKVMKKTD